MGLLSFVVPGSVLNEILPAAVSEVDLRPNPCELSTSLDMHWPSSYAPAFGSPDVLGCRHILTGNCGAAPCRDNRVSANASGNYQIGTIRKVPA